MIEPHYSLIMQRIGKCPICESGAELMDVLKVDEHYHIVHQNEYYKHIKTESGLDIIYKRNGDNRRDLF
jgi:uncharacterized ferritin-like protein (DUF455 family)